VALYIVSAYWFTASTSFVNPAVAIARSMTNTFSGIAPSCVLAFIAAQIVGAILAVAVSEKLFGKAA
jgi:glycerol uptake facilitator-like aquaporin